MASLHQTAGIRDVYETIRTRGVYETISSWADSSETRLTRDQLYARMLDLGIVDTDAATEELLSQGLVRRDGVEYGLTVLALKTTLLVGAINGRDLFEVYDALGQLDPTLQRYELVREGMAGAFLRSLRDRPEFSHVYICSPWVNLSQRERGFFATGLLEAQKQVPEPEVLVITRPHQDRGWVVPPSLDIFQRMGATIFLNPKLHTKLYIREPGHGGGHSMAVVGSENLTRSRSIELGIRITSDDQLIRQLVAYFWHIANSSREVGG